MKKQTVGEKLSLCNENFLIAEHLMDNIDCANSYKLLKFRAINQSSNLIDLVRLEEISIFLNKQELCIHKEFGSKVSLFF